MDDTGQHWVNSLAIGEGFNMNTDESHTAIVRRGGGDILIIGW